MRITEGALSSQDVASTSPNRVAVLVVRVGARLCALKIADVAETMRPRPIEPIRGAPAYVRGVSVIRGNAVPVVDLAALMGAVDGGEWTRFVTLKVQGRLVALAVQAVVGVHEIDSSRLDRMPALLDPAGIAVVESLGAIDRDLLVVLRAATAIPDEVWQELRALEATAP